MDLESRVQRRMGVQGRNRLLECQVLPFSSETIRMRLESAIMGACEDHSPLCFCFNYTGPQVFDNSDLPRATTPLVITDAEFNVNVLFRYLSLFLLHVLQRFGWRRQQEGNILRLDILERWFFSSSPHEELRALLLLEGTASDSLALELQVPDCLLVLFHCFDLEALFRHEERVQKKIPPA